MNWNSCADGGQQPARKRFLFFVCFFYFKNDCFWKHCSCFLFQRCRFFTVILLPGFICSLVKRKMFAVIFNVELWKHVERIFLFVIKFCILPISVDCCVSKAHMTGGGQSEWVDEEMNVSRMRLIVQQQTHCCTMLKISLAQCSNDTQVGLSTCDPCLQHDFSSF